MSGDDRTLGEHTRFDENSVCGVAKRHSGRSKSRARDSDTRDTDNKIYRGLKMPDKECLEMIGRCARTQDSMRILSVVWVGGILGRKVDSKRFRYKGYR